MTKIAKDLRKPSKYMCPGNVLGIFGQNCQKSEIDQESEKKKIPRYMYLDGFGKSW